jgi:hypothetical protein
MKTTDKIQAKLNQKLELLKLSGMDSTRKMIEISSELRKEFFAELKNEIGMIQALNYFREIGNFETM